MPGALPRFLVGSPGEGAAAGTLGAVEAGASGPSPGADGVGAVGFALASLALPSFSLLSFSLPSLPLAALVFSALGVSSLAFGSLDFFGSLASALSLTAGSRLGPYDPPSPGLRRTLDLRLP